MIFPASELVLDPQGRVYHLGLHPENISTKIILVGDQDRVAMVSSFFDSIEHTSQHREFITHTGMYRGKRISVVSTGIGTDNIDIVVNELDALVNIDLQARATKKEHTSLEMIRIGTCGILQASIPLFSYLLSEISFGLDNVAHFYEIPFTNEEEQLGSKITNHLQLPKLVTPYLISSDKALNKKLISEKTEGGITITSSGFYGPQGRQLNLKTKTEGINERISSFKDGEHRIVNFEMETSALFALSRGLRHQSTAICLGVANRQKNEFAKGYEQEMKGLIQYVLDRI